MRQLKFFLSIYYFSLTDEGGENKINQFLSLFLKVLTEAGRFGLSFYESRKGTRELTQM